MTDKQSNSADSRSESLSDTEVTVNTSRRRLTGAGLGMSAIFTLASRPVLAKQCTSASGFESGNLSQHGTPPQCTGRTPGYWKNPQWASEWPAPYSQGTCVSNNGNGGNGNGNGNGGDFESGGCSNSPENWAGGTAFHPELYGTKFMANNKILTMNQVMVMNDSTYLGITDTHNLGAHIVAALLNAASGKTDGVLTVAQVKNMWQECQQNGYFVPITGVQWTPARVVEYLQSTMI